MNLSFRCAPRVRFAIRCLALLFIVADAHAGAPAGRYTYPAAGTVLDTKTRLTWQQSIPTSQMSHAASVTYCSGLNLAGTGWRLPTVRELLTLIDYSQTAGGTVPMIDATAFPSTPTYYFWSATLVAGQDGALAWGVLFTGSGGSSDLVASAHAVRCVRGG